ncbi:MAG: YidC/Oxa1 family membrane protein insertase [Candidatus Aquicultor sp.]|nr:YidC/Oxa1 family membrane protein insertase [Candidatus Aquicultor sp.]
MSLWNGLIDLLKDVLQFFYLYVNDYGVAIILLTVAIRIVILPLTIKQTKSMYEMQRLQPKLKELQEKYKDNKEKLQKEMLKFYSEHKVNPFGGCFPLLLQMPVFFALFQMLMKNEDLLRATSLGLFELGKRPSVAFSEGIVFFIPYLVLIVLMALTTYIQQKMMSSDPQQQRMGLMMLPLMVFFGWTLPTGVLLYWITTNTWTIAQQYVTLRLAKQAEVGNGKGN